MEPKREELLELFKVYVDQHAKWADMLHGRIRFFLGISTAIIGGTVAGLFKANACYQFALLSLGPILLFLTCVISISGVLKLYQTLMETMASRAIVEQRLGLTGGIESDSKIKHWGGEPIIANRVLKTRTDFKTPEAWMKDRLENAEKLWIVRLFRGGQILAGVLLLVIIALTCAKFSGKI